MVFFIALASVPLLYTIIRYEEDKDYNSKKELPLLKEHSKAILAYFILFAGITITLTAAFLILPEQTLPTLFQAQAETFEQINPHHNVFAEQQTTTVRAQQNFEQQISLFSKIFMNNFRVMILAILFSFAYGAGAIFILVWNASVIALAAGYTIRTNIAGLATMEGTQGLADYLSIGAHTIFIRYGIHGTIEILAYMVAALAGGIISVAVIRHHYKTEAFENIIIDTADLILIAIGLLVLAGAWEVWITPALAL